MNPPNGQTPLDYLNQIAPQAQKKPLFVLNLRTIILAGVAAVILIIIIAAISGAVAGGKKEPWQRFSARLDVTASVVDGASTNIKNSQLRSLNSNVKIFITNTKRDLATPLKKLDINPAKLPASIVASEKNTGMETRLEDGRLNAKYDSTYAREMSYQLSRILSLLQKLYASSGNQSTKDFLKTAYDNLEPTYKAIADFTASNE